jgi:hypothetical protein
MDQYGSRLLQSLLQTATELEISGVFSKIVPEYGIPLMTDRFGNYVRASNI